MILRQQKPGLPFRFNDLLNACRNRASVAGVNHATAAETCFPSE
ncbi:MAG TPA: hypothetical protein PKE44_00265 [Plasticicumulans sp.]|nr:hypothetical protein [Plasticicumulans sp.]HMW27954.1 hypothetical protein [Plasticicumulans sp.]HMW27978.1 hypothetical protein [Plasticicumulans sp.]HND97339.1 hypothetical protein [Plasticicumulans sp.]HNI21478.1 hypothetical protein [Plasticicumulans sp.]